jgi:hypothetical protein
VARKTARPRKAPKLVPLSYGTVYCELCKDSVRAGQRVAWWRVVGRGGRKRWAAYCQTCHYSNVRQGRAVR